MAKEAPMFKNAADLQKYLKKLGDPKKEKADLEKLLKLPQYKDPGPGETTEEVSLTLQSRKIKTGPYAGLWNLYKVEIKLTNKGERVTSYTQIVKEASITSVLDAIDNFFHNAAFGYDKK